MKTILLVQSHMLPVPDDITVLNNWGQERIVVEGDSCAAFGDVTLLEGDPASFVSWLSPFDTVWTTTSPMMGSWTALNFKPENAKATV